MVYYNKEFNMWFSKYSYLALTILIVDIVLSIISFSFITLASLIVGVLFIVFDFFMKNKIKLIKGLISFFVVFGLYTVGIVLKPLDKYLVAPKDILAYFSYTLAFVIIFLTFLSDVLKNKKDVNEQNPFYNEEVYLLVNEISGKIGMALVPVTLVTTLYLKSWISLIVNMLVIVIIVGMVIILDKVLRKKRGIV